MYLPERDGLDEMIKARDVPLFGQRADSVRNARWRDSSIAYDDSGERDLEKLNVTIHDRGESFCCTHCPLVGCVVE
jgi:hypothetical protein